MPFTPTHMLAGLPIAAAWRGPGIATALIIGTMVPDWPLYIPVGPLYETTHSFTGILTACLPLGVFCVLLFQFALKRPLYELLPEGLRRRVSPYIESRLPLNAKSLAAIAVAVCIGALTHITWDAFTHGRAWGVAAVPALREIWVTVAGVKFPGYMTMQHGSSLVGLPLLLALFFLWYRRAPTAADTARVISVAGRVVWSTVLICVPLAVVVKYQLDAEGTGLWPVVRGLYFGVTAAGFAFILLVLAYAAFYHIAARVRGNADNTP